MAKVSDLVKAVEKGDAAGVRRLLASGADPDERVKGKSLVAFAQRGRDAAEVVLALIEGGADLRRAASDLNLVWAVHTGRLDLVTRFIDAGAELNPRSFSGTPIQAAARDGELAMVKALAEAGADLESGNLVGNPLTAALQHGHEEVACELLARGASARPDVAMVPSPAAWAAKHGMARALRALGDAGGDLEARASFQAVDGEGLAGAFASALSGEPGVHSMSMSDFVSPQHTNATPLIVAAAEGRLECVRVLIERGVDLEALDDAGRSAFEHARAAGHAEVCEALRAAGARETAQRSPAVSLLLACAAGDAAGVERALAEGAPPDARDERREEKNRTPLMIAAARGHEAIVRRLLAAGAPVAARDDDGEARGRRSVLSDDTRGRTALHHAAAAGHAGTVRMLLAAGADPEQQDQGGDTALVSAAGEGHLEAVRTLLEAGARLAPGGGRTALHAAVGSDHTEVALALLDAGAPCNVKSKDGETPLTLAALFDNRALVERLLAAGADPTVPNREKETAAKIADGALRKLLQKAEKAWRESGRQTTAVRDEVEEREAARKRKMADRAPAPGVPSAEELAGRYEQERVRARLAAGCDAEGFRAALREIEQVCGAPAQDHRADVGGFYFRVPSRTRDAVDVESLQTRFLERGVFLFCTDTDLEDGSLVALPTTDRYDALAVMGTNGCNYDIGTEHVIRWLMDRAATHPHVITTVRGSMVAGRFLTPIDDPEELAQSMYELCPDIVDQGTDTVEALAESLAESSRLYFWWD